MYLAGIKNLSEKRTDLINQLANSQKSWVAAVSVNIFRQSTSLHCGKTTTPAHCISVRGKRKLA